jgi:hypothetical protein
MELIECADLGLIQDIPDEMLNLELKNTELVKSKKLYRLLFWGAVIGFIVYLIVLAKSKPVNNENGEKVNKSNNENANANLRAFNSPHDAFNSML